MTAQEWSVLGTLASLGLVWAGYTEVRLKQVQAKLNEANFETQKAQNQVVVEHLSDTDLRDELDMDLGKRPPKS